MSTICFHAHTARRSVPKMAPQKCAQRLMAHPGTVCANFPLLLPVLTSSVILRSRSRSPCASLYFSLRLFFFATLFWRAMVPIFSWEGTERRELSATPMACSSHSVHTACVDTYLPIVGQESAIFFSLPVTDLACAQGSAIFEQSDILPAPPDTFWSSPYPVVSYRGPTDRWKSSCTN